MGLLEWYSLILGSNVFGEDKAWRAMLRPIVCNGLRPVSASARASLGAQYSRTPTRPAAQKTLPAASRQTSSISSDLIWHLPSGSASYI